MAGRRRQRPLILRGFTIPEVLVVLVIAGVLVSALMAIQVELGRSESRVSSLWRLVMAPRSIDVIDDCHSDANRWRTIAGPAEGAIREAGQAVRSDGSAAGGVGYTAYWSADRRRILAVYGERCGLPERCAYDVAARSCRDDREGPR